MCERLTSDQSSFGMERLCCRFHNSQRFLTRFRGTCTGTRTSAESWADAQLRLGPLLAAGLPGSAKVTAGPSGLTEGAAGLTGSAEEDTALPGSAEETADLSGLAEGRAGLAGSAEEEACLLNAAEEDAGAKSPLVLKLDP